MSKWLDRLNPARQLPKPMRRYLALPDRLFLAWLLLSGLILAAALTGKSESAPADSAVSPAGQAGPAPAAAAEAHLVANIAVSGSPSFTVIGKDGRIFVTPEGQPALALVNDADGLRVEQAAGGLVYRLKLKDDEQGKVYDAAGVLRHRLKCETEEGEETCKLYDGHAYLLNRIKLKPDSFNVYGAGSERLYKGKLKNGVYALKSEAGEAVLTIKGVNSLKAAALLSLPVDIPIRALLWRQTGW